MPDLIESTKLAMEGRWEALFREWCPEWKLDGSSRERKAFCPFHDDHNPSLSVNVESGLYYCHACGAAGDGFHLVMKWHGVSMGTALKEVARWAGTIQSSNGAAPPSVDPMELQRQSDILLRTYSPPARETVLADELREIEPQIVEAYHSNLLANVDRLMYLTHQRGLNQEMIVGYRIGWDGERYTIPIPDVHGTCRNIRRYMPNPPAGVPKMLNFREGYGLARMFPNRLERGEDGDDILLCEGEWDTLLTRQYGFAAVTGTGGVNRWRDEWTALFTNKDVVICFDSDQRRDDEPAHVTKGRENAQKVAAILYPVARTVKVIDLYPDTNAGGDLTDFLNGNNPFLGQSPDLSLKHIIQMTPRWTPATPIPFTPEQLAVRPTITEFSIPDEQIIDDLVADGLPEQDARSLIPPVQIPPDPPAGAGGAARGLEDPLAGVPPHTDTANAGRFAARHGHTTRWVAGLGWHLWDGTRWKPDKGGRVMEMAKETARSIVDEATALTQQDRDDDAKKRFAWAITSLNSGKLDAMTRLAQSIPGILIEDADAMDADPMQLGVENGTIDLRTGELRTALAGDLITKQCPVFVSADASCPRWEMFVQDVMGGNMEMVAYLHRAVGYALTALTSEKCFFLLHGSGNNGKTIFLETVGALLGNGDYWTPMSFSTLTSKSRSGPNEDIARLRGSRYVTAIETNEGQAFNEALVKQLTGGDTISARFLHQNSFNFRPTFKLFLGTNHKPDVKGTDKGMWDRIRLIPFDERFSSDPDEIAGGARPARRKEELEAELLQELPGIFNWALAGCLAWQQQGLGTPPTMKAAVKSYRIEQNDVAGFIESACVLGTEFQVEATTLYQRYTDWCSENDREPKTQNAFGRAMTAAGHAAVRSMKVRFRDGLRLKNDDDRSDESVVGRIDPDDYTGVGSESVINTSLNLSGEDEEAPF